MVRFNELRITKDGKYLVIDVSVRSQSYYNDVYLDSISIDTQDTYKDGGPSSSIVYFKDITSEGDRIKNYRLELSVGEFLPSLSDNMFFVYVKAKGVLLQILHVVWTVNTLLVLHSIPVHYIML